jgi:hypothetical protein
MNKIVGQIILLTAISAFSAGMLTGELKQWHRVSVTFDGPSTSETAVPNPFRNYRMDVTFTSPAGVTFKVPGFFASDGNAGETSASSGNKWRVNFCPDITGTWRYAASFVTGTDIAAELTGGSSAGFFNGDTGSLIIAATDKSGIDLRGKGKVEYTGAHYLRHRGTGDNFILAGPGAPEVFLEYADFDNTNSTRTYPSHVVDWQTGDPVWKSTRGKGIIGAVNYMSSIGCNVNYFIPMNAYGDGQKAWPWVHADSITRYDCSKLDQWEVVFEHFDRKGLMMELVLTETENESYFEVRELGVAGGFVASRKIYYREMVARFGHHIAIAWNIGEENGWDAAGFQTANTDTQRKQFADRLRALTYYQDHICIHNGPSSDVHIYAPLVGYPSLTGPSMQLSFGTGIHGLVLSQWNQSQTNGHKWVCTVSEPATGDQEIWRKEVVWGTFMAGGAGMELYLGGGLDLTEQNYRTYEPYYLAAVRAAGFIRTLPVDQMTPDDNLISGRWSLKKPGECYAIYLKTGGTASLNLAGVTGTFSVQWFDPRNGGALRNGSATTVTGGTSVSIGNPPDNPTLDWVALVRSTAIVPVQQMHAAATTGDVRIQGAIIRITNPYASPVRITLVRMDGVTFSEVHNGVLSAGSHVFPLARGRIPAGVYFAQVKVGNRESVARFQVH